MVWKIKFYFFEVKPFAEATEVPWFETLCAPESGDKDLPDFPKTDGSIVGLKTLTSTFSTLAETSPYFGSVCCKTSWQVSGSNPFFHRLSFISWVKSINLRWVWWCDMSVKRLNPKMTPIPVANRPALFTSSLPGLPNNLYTVSWSKNSYIGDRIFFLTIRIRKAKLEM